MQLYLPRSTPLPASPRIPRLARTVGTNSSVGGMTTYTTTFDTTENPLSEGGAWVGGGTVGLDWTDPQTSGGLCYPTQTTHSLPPYDDSVAMLAGTWPADTTITTTLGMGAMSGSHEAEHYHRMTVAAHSVKGYEVDLMPASGGLAIVLWRGALNSFVSISSNDGWTFADGDVWKSAMIGDVLTVWQNNTQRMSVDLRAWSTTNAETFLASGNPGIGFWYQASDAKNLLGWKDFLVTT